MKPLRRLAASIRNLLSTEQVSDPAVRAYLDRRGNWLAMLAAVTMMAITWPVLGETLDVPAYVLPVLALVSVLPLLGIAAGSGPAWAGWIGIVVACLITAPLPKSPGHDDLRIAVPQFLILLAMTLAALVTVPLVRLFGLWLVTVIVLLICVGRNAVDGWVFALTVITIGVAFLRYWRSSRREIAEQTEQTEVHRAREEVLAERSRIARELHDVVAHRMSMVVVMSQTARYRLAQADEPEEISPAVAAEFEAIAGAARESLDEVRTLLGVLRTDETGAPDGAAEPPAPGIDGLAALIDDVRSAGVPIEFDDASDHSAVGDAPGLVVYRIVQESLSNAVRHAPGAPVRVRVEPDPDGTALTVTVVNEAPPAGPLVKQPARIEPATGSGGRGLGVRGMRERAAALGGSLTAVPTGAGGFEVVAVVPSAAAKV
ncbi:MAG: histidine kinase [Gordonia sp. (in: high G+C Gram-positive bacteria)]|uniref:sensor histidine kinase n=1 Tax=Gordonia sp. (in: high G+C Gram-positive bacteria) TaxID=84139 RepID=UPI0039E59C60